jgi:hypothetical protein
VSYSGTFAGQIGTRFFSGRRDIRIYVALCEESPLFFFSSGQILIHHNRCRYCSSGDNLTIDHVIPISRGGKWEWENLVRKSSASTKPI